MVPDLNIDCQNKERGSLRYSVYCLVRIYKFLTSVHKTEIEAMVKKWSELPTN